VLFNILLTHHFDSEVIGGETLAPAPGVAGSEMHFFFCPRSSSQAPASSFLFSAGIMYSQG